MKPQNKEFVQEDILIDEFVNAEITDIEYDQEHKSTYQGQEKTGPAVRFKMKLLGYEQPKLSRWYSFSYSEKANLYKIWIKGLVPNAAPFMDFDLDQLKNQKCRVMFSKATLPDGRIFYNVDMVKPVSTKPPKQSNDQELISEEVPF